MIREDLFLFGWSYSLSFFSFSQSQSSSILISLSSSLPLNLGWQQRWDQDDREAIEGVWYYDEEDFEEKQIDSYGFSYIVGISLVLNEIVVNNVCNNGWPFYRPSPWWLYHIYVHSILFFQEVLLLSSSLSFSSFFSSLAHFFLGV